MATLLGIASDVTKNGNRNKLDAGDRRAHGWYRFVLSFPPHLVRDYLKKLKAGPGCLVLDPFCGTGTTPVECKMNGVRSVGVEAAPMAAFASRVKTDWSPDPNDLLEQAEDVARRTRRRLRAQGIEDDELSATAGVALRGLPSEADKLLLTSSISKLPLHKTLVLLDAISALKSSFYVDHLKLALAKALIADIGNLHFGPEVGVAKPKKDVRVVESWLARVRVIADDLRELNDLHITPARIVNEDSRGDLTEHLLPRSVDVVITSPPYPNEKDYTRTTRLESVILGLVRTKAELQQQKRTLVRSNTRSVYVSDDDHRWVEKFPEIGEIADAIEKRRLELGKTSGFERMYPRVTKLYFGGMARHFANLRKVLKRGARLAYVVGDQASYLRVMIRTGQLLGTIAEDLGYRVDGIDLFRTRLATATKEQLREEVLRLTWVGNV